MARVKVYDKTTQKWVYADKSFGQNGNSVTVENVTESTADGGSNVVTFSDGKTLTVRNGSKGTPGPVSTQAKFAISESVDNQDSVCVIEETEASISASDNSAYFDAEYIVVEKDTYKLGKEAMLALQNKKLTGNGSVAWKDWDTQPQGWKDAETNHNSSAPLTTAKLKVRYADDPVYMSMKLPGEGNVSSDTLVRPGMRASNASGTYTIANNIGVVCAIDYTRLPDDVVICIGHLSLYTLSREKNAKWKLHDKQVIPTGQAMYYLPWSGSNDQREDISASKITVNDDHVRFTLQRGDFAPSSSVPDSIAKCLHFWGAHNSLDLADNLAVVCFYEAWTETEAAVGNLYTTIGCDQKSTDKAQIEQNFWGRNVLLSTEKIIVIGHNISDELYDQLRDTPNDPRLVFADYGTSFASEYDSKTEVASHNSSPNAHPDIREEIDFYMGDMQSRIEQVTDVIQSVEIITPGLNINDGVYETGYINSAGDDHDDYHDMSFRSANYIPVEGGRTIALYYAPAEWNGNNKGKPFYIVQYDSNKNKLTQREFFKPYVDNQATYTLLSNTAYIRIAFNNWSAYTTPVSDIKVAIYYIEDYRNEFLEYEFGSEIVYGVSSDSVYVQKSDGTQTILTEEIASLAKKTELSPMVDEALEQAKASGEFDGKDGTDGVGIASIKQTTTSTEDGGNNILTVTLTNGTSTTFTVKNGSKGSSGSSGTDVTITAESIIAALGYTPASTGTNSSLTGKKIVYDGDSICAAAFSYPKLIADKTACIYDNQAVGGARLCSYSGAHSVVDNLPNLPTDGDLYCFQGGINDFWANTPVGTYTRGDYTGTVDPTTIYGAMETIFRYALTNFFGKAICFVITHKIKNTMYTANTEGKTFWDYRDAMINVCEKYSIPYYDAFAESGLNGWHNGHVAGLFMNADGIHPTETAYEAYYVPQLIQIFEQAIPVGDYEAPVKPATYENVLKTKTVDSSGNPYNGGTGIKENYYLDGNAAETASTNYDVTGFIPVIPGDILRFRNMQICKIVNGNSKCQIHYFASDKSLAGKTSYLKAPSDLSAAWEVVTNEAGTDILQLTIPTALASVRWVRICCGTLTSASVITINEEID